ncbi:PREDICTED: protein Smaug homolog 1 [Trachymyrmex cornetzi]|uniref:Protein Smaug n=1 Tax=Trachymyrmex cornetzi TaxID=471704 RepID=A0A195EL93_9HYME|nr:PREDICTED: protein Smaug homolog 1 [Trachymyrmex cornetzi]XP_018374537.1 PREDICTED: protein Smaug homolog 1 [Trachymyrmex cornetzi]XP_018374545.1 PREDICTED: protein Smaug homolog 1 [Trachymyrmex cornetzi]KYN28901.1 Protein Smaug like protein 1 [Trachymyrmex cornetzi]
MKWTSATPFNEQVGELTRVFSQWNECEQTVVLYALLRIIPAVQARFLSQAIEHSLHSVAELDTKEINANNPSYINSLSAESTEIAINQLLTHLPLLKPGNVECKKSYLVAIPELVNHCVSTGQYTEQTQQLLSYTLIHPAINGQDRRLLTQWLRDLEDRISSTPPITGFEDYSNATMRWDNPWQRNSKHHNDQPNSFNTQPGGTFNLHFPASVNRQRRSNSLTPPVAPPHHLEIVDRTNNTNSSSRHKPRSFSVSGDHASNIIGLGPLSPQGSCASSGSEGRLDDASNRSLASGMRDVQLWLKTLRLHKYSYLFATMNYEDMLQLTEDQLAEQGVTKGARHKLALSIAKLQQRYNTLLNLEKGLVQPSTRDGMQNTSFSQGPSLLLNTMEELKTILATPMKPSQENDPQDIPAQFTKVLGKLCSRLALESVEDGILCTYVNILEKVLQHDCFTPNQKEKVQQWRSRLGNPRPTPKWQHNYGYNNRRYGNPQQHRKPSLNMNHIHNNHTHSSQFMIASHRNSISTPYLQNNQNQNHNMNSMNMNNLRAVHTTEKRPSLQETSLQQLQKTLQRAYSAPRDHFVSHSANGANETTEPEINSRLESLCLRMTEQAIGGFGEA